MSDPLVQELREWLKDYDAGHGFAVKPSVIDMLRRAVDALGAARQREQALSHELELAADSFRDLSNVLRLIGENFMSAAADIAERHIREHLKALVAAPQGEPR